MGDPLDDFLRYDRDQAEAEAKQPKCCSCGRTIWDEYLFYIDGIYCEDCMINEFRKFTEDYYERT